MIFNILALRITLFIYNIADSLAKKALFCMYAIEMPVLIITTIIGQWGYTEMKNDLYCVSLLLCSDLHSTLKTPTRGQ